MYWVSTKKVSQGNFQHYQDYLQWIFFCKKNYRQSTISEQILETFGQYQNCYIKQYSKKFFCKKIYHDVVIHLPNFQLSAKSSSFFCAFFLHFYGVLFCGHPIPSNTQKYLVKWVFLIDRERGELPLLLRPLRPQGPERIDK